MGRGRAAVRRRRAIAVAVAVVLAATAAATAGISQRSSEPAGGPAPASGLPPPIRPSFTPGPPRPLGSTRHVSVWAPVRRPVTARAAPSSAAAPVAELPARTPEGTDNAVAVIGRRQDRGGISWIRVRLAVLPNGTTGWVPRTALGGYVTVDTRLDVDLHRLAATLYVRGRRVFRAPIGVGTPAAPTPPGEFYVRNRLTRYRSPTYGPVAFGTSARSPTATDWPAGGFIGIHGTDQPELLPGRVSHGCIRMRDADILALARRMPVGTPVTIHG
jgi:lipoprotein-anchoring transpeptidase ErfK/SrfK